MAGTTVRTLSVATAVEAGKRNAEAKTAFAKAMPRHGIAAIFFIRSSLFICLPDSGRAHPGCLQAAKPAALSA